MLRIIQNTSAAGASSYFTASDYYTQEQELPGLWRGEGARLLGLSGEIRKDAWEALCHNRDPRSGDTLTARKKAERRVGWDFNFHVPKSVSLQYALSNDQRILDAFRASVHETMKDIEAELMTRVRQNGSNEDRLTGNAVWGEFVHFTTRPIDGMPDPHMHAHCFLQNVTFDASEQRWKAAQIGHIKRDGPYFEAMFHSRFARRMEELGYATQRVKTGWELTGYSPPTLRKFSRRRQQIEEVARELQAKADQEHEAALKDGRETGRRIVTTHDLGASTREKKQKDLTMPELRQKWRARLTDAEDSAFVAIARQSLRGPIAEQEGIGSEASMLAVDHCFERKSVVPERQLYAEALKRAVGKAAPHRVLQAVRNQNLIVGERDGRRVATTKKVLSEEQAMVAFARNGRGTCAAFVTGDYRFRRGWLDEGQKKAVLHLLRSSDRVQLLRGVAGTGKTTLMQEAVEGIEATGIKVFTFAPSSDASHRVLREDAHFADADTVAMLLKDQRKHEKMRGQVIWIDEAGLVGASDMARVLSLADQLDARVILSGDRKQHGSVARGAALRLLETEAGLIPAELKDIRRQSGAYKAAVTALSQGRTEEGFRGLDKLGWIREVSEADRYKLLARDYVDAVAARKTALVVSPTHREGDRITAEIRLDLKRRHLLGEERTFRTLASANLTAAERGDALSYEPSDVIEFHQNATGYRKGTRITVGDVEPPLRLAERFTAYRTAELTLAAGDQIRLTKNGETVEGARLYNGTLFTVKGFDKDGNIRLQSGGTLDKGWGHWTYGYCTTSHASQGRSVDRVFIGQSSDSFPASSREQFYVSCSRGKEQATIYTDSKAELMQAVCHSDDRLTATELVMGDRHKHRAMTLTRMEFNQQPSAPAKVREQEIGYER